ncbi:hypothetical protein ATO10_03862, partial [Actibacterium atlanticum]
EGGRTVGSGVVSKIID